MKCQTCGDTKTSTYDTRPIKNGEFRWRRRKCLACGTRFTTIELTVKAQQKIKTALEEAKEKMKTAIKEIDYDEAVGESISKSCSTKRYL